MKKLISVICVLQGLSAGDGYKGFGLQVGEQGTGVFFHQVWRYSPELEWLFHGRMFDVKGEEFMMVYDPYYNQYRGVGDKYVMIVPMFVGGKYFPFVEQIANNFSPYVSLMAGPVLTMDGYDSDKFTERWKRSQGLWTFGAYLGVGADFLMVNLITISAGVGIDYLPMNEKVKGQEHFSGAIIHIAYNWRR